MMKQRLFWLLILFLPIACAKDTSYSPEAAANSDYFHRAMKRLTDVIVHDIFSPPVASRIYAYSSIAGYEAALPGHPEYQSLARQLTSLAPAPQPEVGKEYCYPLASVYAMLKVGQALIFSEDTISLFRERILQEFKDLGIPRDVYNRSIAYGEAVGNHILSWAAADNYSQTRSYPKYTISDNPATWQPTPPAYMDGIEPSWNKIRPFVLDSAQQFVPPPPTAFSTDKNSRFYRETMEVYAVLQTDDAQEAAEREAIARFWDCNPYVVNQIGHVMFASKKITPGGHWVNIVRIAATQAQADFMKTTAAYALTSVALADGFISCWDEKYRSNLIRPESYINKYIDEEWTPLLQTPPFPEYTSGHSVISRAAATVLTSIFGDNFAFVDDSEEEFGLPARRFRSFLHASEEAAVSRLYGGIHYMPAIENGVQQGAKVGQWVLSNVKMRNEAVSMKQTEQK
ncbi:MAG TPA: vanadium-dependent haloperoxidase [Saprospiraceae bacterium]|nr:vanadium-dependent haloperoxidase [Saprospiraceae bacterium]HMP23465.1 vanadium-dependent haloperoxidase [Saprospiraceae bacterium]